MHVNKCGWKLVLWTQRQSLEGCTQSCPLCILQKDLPEHLIVLHTTLLRINPDPPRDSIAAFSAYHPPFGAYVGANMGSNLELTSTPTWETIVESVESAQAGAHGRVLVEVVRGLVEVDLAANFGATFANLEAHF